MTLLLSLVGMLALMFIAWLASENRRAIRWRTVLGALALQTGFAALVLYFPPGQVLLGALSNGVSALLGFADSGIRFVFGDLASNGFIFAVRVLPLVIFISALIAVLYHFGIMQWVIRVLGGGIHRLLGTSRAESLVATGNIFLSQGESPLLIRPFLAGMTRSELFAVMTCGMASVAGSVLGGYAGLGVELKYLIAASFMAAPGGLLMAKLLVPEQERVREQDEIALDKSDYSNAIDALAGGAMGGMKIAVAIGTILLAFVSAITMLNAGFTLVGEWLGWPELSLQLLLGYLFAPVAWLIGVPASEMMAAGSLIGQKVIMNEFVAYLDFASIKENLSAHTQIIVTFALCGFANLGSIAIQLGAIGTLAPERRHDVANLGLKAVLAATLANLMSATLAGIFATLG
ncbi:NupC/NupG family nucleoside CNT transporter [Aeromonas sp. SrichE-2G]|uniref:NupC/NupG family nucleoside CNT transporter n=1 Tax=Aeromonas sp. SrichE-2G TaxID=2823359 RepID=UPI001B345442|nr:NupC/NupG family nucleoside CNT transporter [Aeromonas sp. SrichE-2G]MBP4043136.1 NupC/NupG family nucleoside CNT transporter [Aeromonas sp. SrichE-2G]